MTTADKTKELVGEFCEVVESMFPANPRERYADREGQILQGRGNLTFVGINFYTGIWKWPGGDKGRRWMVAPRPQLVEVAGAESHGRLIACESDYSRLFRQWSFRQYKRDVLTFCLELTDCAQIEPIVDEIKEPESNHPAIWDTLSLNDEEIVELQDYLTCCSAPDADLRVTHIQNLIATRQWLASSELDLI